MRRYLLSCAFLVATFPVVAQSSPESAPFGDVASRSGGGESPAATSGPAAERPLTAGDKFRRFATQTADPGNLLGAGVEAGLSQISHDNLGFGQGADGFGKRYGAALADRASLAFFSQYALPTAFRQDPRYRRLGDGGFRRRFWHAGTRAFIGRRDSGGRMFNISTIGGAFLSAALANTYYPDGERTVGFTLRSGGLNVGSAMGVNLGREFWPDIKRKFFKRNSAVDRTPKGEVDEGNPVNGIPGPPES